MKICLIFGVNGVLDTKCALTIHKCMVYCAGKTVGKPIEN